MEFTFNHEEKDLFTSLGLTQEDAMEMDKKVKKLIAENTDDSDVIATSKLIEIFLTKLEKEELSFMAAYYVRGLMQG